MGNLHGIRRTSPRQIGRSAITSAVLSLLFIVVYGGCSWITSLRSDVGSLFFAWEQHIPLIPILIIPYMSIDLFFAGAPFLCTSKEERRLLSKRIVFAILVAGAFFLLMPLQNGFPRKVPDGWLGGIFQFLHGFDRPYNLFPSLHITLRTILADTYTRHTKGALKWSLHVWFSLIGLSTIFTYQHHVVDVLGGFVLAIFCFYLIRPSHAHPKTTNRRIGHYYAMAAILLSVGAYFAWPWGGLLLWPTTSLSLVSLSYYGLIGHLYRKENGRLPLNTLWLHWPALWGQYLSLLYYKLQAKSWSEVAPNLWLGRKLSDTEAEEAGRLGVTAVLDLTSEFTEAKPFRESNYLNIPVLDLTAPTRQQLDQGVAFIERELTKGVVYVHCKIGYSRSAAIVGAYLLASGGAKGTQEAIKKMREARPSLVVREEIVTALEEYVILL